MESKTFFYALLAVGIGVIAWIFLKSRTASAAENPDSLGGDVGGGIPASGGVISGGTLGGMTNLDTGSQGGMARGNTEPGSSAANPLPDNSGKADGSGWTSKPPSDTYSKPPPGAQPIGDCGPGQTFNGTTCVDTATGGWGGKKPMTPTGGDKYTDVRTPGTSTAVVSPDGTVKKLTAPSTGKSFTGNAVSGARAAYDKVAFVPGKQGADVAPSLAGVTFKKDWNTATQVSDRYGKVNADNKWGGR